MRAPVAIGAALLTTVCLWANPARAQQVTKESVPGVVNFARVETTVACAGATDVKAIPAIKDMGFKSIINLRQPTEQGANIEAEADAAKAAGLNFVSIPFSASSPNPAAADRFVEVITKPGAEPAFIHCAGGGRAATMWLIKRLAVDHWDADRAVAEATALGLNNAAMKQFALDYAQAHKR